MVATLLSPRRWRGVLISLPKLERRVDEVFVGSKKVTCFSLGCFVMFVFLDALGFLLDDLLETRFPFGCFGDSSLRGVCTLSLLDAACVVESGLPGSVGLKTGFKRSIETFCGFPFMTSLKNLGPCV